MSTDDPYLGNVERIAYRLLISDSFSMTEFKPVSGLSKLISPLRYMRVAKQ